MSGFSPFSVDYMFLSPPFLFELPTDIAVVPVLVNGGAAFGCYGGWRSAGVAVRGYGACRTAGDAVKVCGASRRAGE